MISHGVATEAECDKIEVIVRAEIEAAVEFARNSPFPEPEELYEDMWATSL